MKNKLFLLPAVLLICSTAFAQDNFTKGSFFCSQKKLNSMNISNLFEADSPNNPKHSFDVLDYKINLDIRSCFISPYPKSYIGYVIVKFKVDSALSSIKLNAVNTSLTVSSVVNERQNPGTYQVVFDGSDIPGGVYFYKFESGNFIETRRMILLK